MHFKHGRESMQQRRKIRNKKETDNGPEHEQTAKLINIKGK
jgi:hypothetical protein